MLTVLKIYRFSAIDQLEHEEQRCLIWNKPRYLISLISQDSLSMLNELEQSDTPQENES